MGESALLLVYSSRISDRANGRVHSMYRWLKTRSVKGVIELVPAYSSLLVRFDPILLSEGALREALTGAGAQTDFASEQPPPRAHEISVVYGGEYGPDLAALAFSHNLTEPDAIRLHTGRTYKVYFLGFMPGFAYLGSVDRRLATRRKATPRLRVEAGSLGIADTQTAVYPFASPGGWNLIGRAGAALWDPYREPPALLAPADRVRFVQVDRLHHQSMQRPADHAPRWPVFRVLGSAGAQTTIQDLGRAGYG